MEASERTRIVTAAFDLVKAAAKILDQLSEMQTSAQLRGVVALAPLRSSVAAELRVPLALTTLALGLLDEMGRGGTTIACHLQTAINRFYRTGADPLGKA